MSKNKGLGRGLDALLSGEIEESSSADQLKTMPVTALQPGKYQPRTFMDPASLESLAESIRAQGIMQPIVVRKVSQDRYEIIAGERRWRAAQLNLFLLTVCIDKRNHARARCLTHRGLFGRRLDDHT